MEDLLLSVAEAFAVLVVLLIIGIAPYAQTTTMNSISQNTTTISTITSTPTTTTIPPAITYALAFNTIPATGGIVFNGITHSDGSASEVAAGSYNTSAVAPSNFVFSNWSYTGNIIVINATEPDTIVSVLGNGTITANFNALTAFSENGLPANAVWSVIYDGVVQNAIVPNGITFSTLPGNHTFSATNDIVNNTSYTASPQYGYLIAGNTTGINFTPVSQNTTASTTTSTSTSTSTSMNTSSLSTSTLNTTLSTSANSTTIPPLPENNIATNITALLYRYGIPSNSVFISNASISGTYENGTTSNIIAPLQLSYQEMSNLTALSQNQISVIRSKLNRSYTDSGVALHGFNTRPQMNLNNLSAVHSFNESIDVPYGDILQMNRYVKAGSVLQYVAYNTHGIVTYYRVNIEKAQPKLAIKVNGDVLANPNSTTLIHVPILRGQRSYKISLSLNSSLDPGNMANYSYRIEFSNGTVINESINSSGLDYSNVFTLPSDQNATVTFETGGDSNYTPVDPTGIIIPTQIDYYVPIALANLETNQTPAPFQQMVPVNSLTYNTYEAGNLDNIEFFYADGNVIPSWMEGSTSNTLLNNPTNSIYMYKSTNTIYWLNISNGIPASNSITVYMGFASNSVNLMNNVSTGEAPELSPSYAEYDDGASVFLYYNVNPTSTNGWTVVGSAGNTSTAPGGSHFLTTNALYANSAYGDYLYTSIPHLSSNIIISYNVYTDGLGDLFFLANSSGKGQMTRLDSRHNYQSGLATTSSWTSWAAPSGIYETSDIWYKYDVVVSGSSAYAYIGNVSDSLATYGTPTSSSAFQVIDNGNYIGLVGDALGSSYITYWNGMIIRAYPPNGVMPDVTFGSVSSTSSPVLTLKTPVNYGATDLISASKSGDTLEIERNGSVIAGPASNTINYTVCGPTPSLASCWTAGKYMITANDITDGKSSNITLTINKVTPSLKLSAGNIIFSGSSLTINYSISETIGNQLTANLIINGATVASTYSSGSYTFTPTEGLYTFEVETPGDKNYTSSQIIVHSCAVPDPSHFPSNVIYYAPICVINNQSSATPSPFQDMVNISESEYAGNILYNGNSANFEIFNAIGDVQPSWIEKNLSGNLVTWVRIANGVPANSITPLYIGFTNKTFNTLSSSGTNGVGEIPTASSTYGEYDDGNSVFDNYFAGSSLTGWTAVGTSGDVTTAPGGSPFGTDAFYANGANGDYLYTTAGGQSTDMIIEYYTDEANLDDVFFLVDSTGGGQIGRVGNGGGWYGIASSASWTSWSAPPDTGTWSNRWLLVSIVVKNGIATMYVSPNPGVYGSEIGQNKSNNYTVAQKGDYLGLVGDAASSSTVQYWNGMIIRAYPPNGVMPSTIFGGVLPVQNTCTISLNPTGIDFGTIDPGSSVATINAIKDTNGGNTRAYMFVYGGNWIGSTHFGVSNTTWATSNGVSFASANRLGTIPANTTLIVPASLSNTVYFGLGVPGGSTSGPYSQTITIENSC